MDMVSAVNMLAMTLAVVWAVGKMSCCGVSSVAISQILGPHLSQCQLVRSGEWGKHKYDDISRTIGQNELILDTFFLRGVLTVGGTTMSASTSWHYYDAISICISEGAFGQ